MNAACGYRAELVNLGGIGDGQRTVADAISTLMHSREQAGLQATTLDIDRWRAGIIQRGLGSRRLQALTVSDCDSFLIAAAAGDYSSATEDDPRNDAARQISTGHPVLAQPR